MTRLSKPVVRETGTVVHERGKRRPLIVELRPGDPIHNVPDMVVIRIKGLRHENQLPLPVALTTSLRLQMHAREAERKSKRRAKTARGGKP